MDNVRMLEIKHARSIVRAAIIRRMDENLYAGRIREAEKLRQMVKSER